MKGSDYISGLLNQIEAGKIGIHTFTNASVYSVDVSADKVELNGTAAGTVVVPIPAVAEDGMETTNEVSVEAELPVAFSAQI